MKTRTILTIFSCFFISVLSSQEKLKDTLFFNLDGKYIFQSKYVSTSYLLKDSNDIDKGTFYFEELEIINNVIPKEILCLKNVVRSSKFYNKQKKRKLDDNGLFEYFDKYIVFLVKENKETDEYIKVRANWEIE